MKGNLRLISFLETDFIFQKYLAPTHTARGTNTFFTTVLLYLIRGEHFPADLEDGHFTRFRRSLLRNSSESSDPKLFKTICTLFMIVFFYIIKLINTQNNTLYAEIFVSFCNKAHILSVIMVEIGQAKGTQLHSYATEQTLYSLA